MSVMDRVSLRSADGTVEIAIGTLKLCGHRLIYVPPSPSEWQRWLDAGWKWTARPGPVPP